LSPADNRSADPSATLKKPAAAILNEPFAVIPSLASNPQSLVLHITADFQGREEFAVVLFSGRKMPMLQIARDRPIRGFALPDRTTLLTPRT
jgi:hypothetical protein